MYYICPEHNLAWESFPSLVFHYLGGHKDGSRPIKEEAEHEELPEGVTLRVKPQREKPRDAQGDAQGEREFPQERESLPSPLGRTPQAEEYTLEELPTDPPELFYSLLRLKGVNEQTSQRLRREFRLSPWMWSDAQEIASLLRGAKVGGSQDWVRSFLKQYGNTVQLPSEEGGLGFIGQRRSSKEEFFGRLEPQGREDPLSTFIKYQMLKEDKATEGRQRALDPEAEQRLKAIEASHQQLMDVQNKLVEMLQKQEREAEKSALEARFIRLEGLIVQRGEGTQETSWLSQFLAEREKRFESLISGMTDKLASATSAVAEARQDAKGARAEAIADENRRFDEVKKKLEETGFAPRAKTTEERMFDLVEGQVAPAVVSEVREGRKLLERAVGMMPSAQLGATTTLPVSAEEATNLAAILEIEQQLKSP